MPGATTAGVRRRQNRRRLVLGLSGARWCARLCRSKHAAAQIVQKASAERHSGAFVWLANLSMAHADTAADRGAACVEPTALEPGRLAHVRIFTQARAQTMGLAFALALAGMQCACATHPQAPISAQQREQDEVLATRVRRALRADPSVYARHIEVSCERGVVRLTGFVFSGEDAHLALRAAQAVEGVRDVANDIEVDPAMVRQSR